ncbi:MAG: hypothetical protein HY298_07970 [Verrucomicrobia bacterium]|nr:hypothetical protein [Verrucomicrobiota bacterium]
MKKSVFIRGLAALAVALLALLPCSLLAVPIVVSINDVPNGAPVIQVNGAPNGYDVYTGAGIATPGIEDGALITLIGVDQSGLIPDWGGRFVVPEAPLWFRTAVDIIWVGHDEDVIGNGDLQIGFNSALPGTYYFNPGLINPATGLPINEDENLGLVTDEWVTVYANDTLVVRYKPHTYRLLAQVERPFKIAGQVSTVIQLDGSFAFDASSGSSVGVSTAGGSFTAAGSGNAFTGVWSLTATSANGDQISGYHVPGSIPDEFRFTSGTGRFAGVSGEFTYVTSVPSIIPNPDGSATLIISYSYEGTGTITY